MSGLTELVFQITHRILQLASLRLLLFVLHIQVVCPFFGEHLLFECGLRSCLITPFERLRRSIKPFLRNLSLAIDLLAELNFIRDRFGHAVTDGFLFLLHIYDELLQHPLRVFDLFSQRGDAGFHDERELVEPLHESIPF